LGHRDLLALREVHERCGGCQGALEEAVVGEGVHVVIAGVLVGALEGVVDGAHGDLVAVIEGSCHLLDLDPLRAARPRFIVVGGEEVEVDGVAELEGAEDREEDALSDGVSELQVLLLGSAILEVLNFEQVIYAGAELHELVVGGWICMGFPAGVVVAREAGGDGAMDGELL